MASCATVSICSSAGEVILPAAQIYDHEDVQVLTKLVQAATSAKHVALVSETGQTLINSCSARSNGIAHGDQLTAVFNRHDVVWVLPRIFSCIVRYDITSGTVCKIEHGAKCGRNPSFGGAVCIGDKTYFMPVDSDAMLVYNNITEEVISVDISCYAKGGGKFSATIVANEKIYFVPMTSNQLLVYDVASSEFSGVDIRHVARSQIKWHSAALAGDNIIAFPCGAKAILVYNIVTGEASGITVSPGYGFRRRGESPLVQDGEKFYVLPNGHSTMLMYDSESQSVSEVEVDGVEGYCEWAGGAVVDGRLFALPSKGDFIWVYDVVFQISSRIDISMFGDWWSKMTNIGGVLHCAAHPGGFLLQFDTKTGQISSMDVSSFVQHEFVDVMVVKDKLYFFPPREDSIFFYDSAAGGAVADDILGMTESLSTLNWRLGVHVVEH